MQFNLSEFIKTGAIISLTDGRVALGWGSFARKHANEIITTIPSFHITDFFLKQEKPWIQYEHNCILSLQEFNSFIECNLPQDPPEWIIPNIDLFKCLFQKLHFLIASQELEKAVPYLFTKTSDKMTNERLLKCLKKGLKQLLEKKGYLYGCWTKKSGFLGITPEILFSHSNCEPEIVHTVALAGTSHTAKEALLKNEKEIHEHNIVIKGILNSLRSLGNTIQESTQILHLNRLSHLMTSIHLHLNQPFHFHYLLNALHPTPALGVFPKEKGPEWLIKYNRHFPRNYYGAPFGFQNSNHTSTHCLVAIRNVQWDSKGMKIAAGCGVVKKSQLELECAEINLKIAAIKEQFDL